MLYAYYLSSQAAVTEPFTLFVCTKHQGSAVVAHKQTMMKVLPTLLLAFSLLPLAEAEAPRQDPYRRIALRTRVKVRSSREKDARYRYSRWGDLCSSDRRYTQKVRLRITLTNVSGVNLRDLRVQYRIYNRSLDRNTYSVAASGEIPIPQLQTNKSRILFTDPASCQYRLRWDRYVRGNRLSRSGEKYAGYVVIYCDSKGPLSCDRSSQTLYEEYVKELRMAQKLHPGASPSVSKESGPLPYSTETTVYVTRTGRKFHRRDCRFVRGGARPLSREEALKSGYTPCSVCKP